MLNRYRLRPLLVLFVAAIALFSLTGSANAEEIYQGDTIPAGTTVENDVILSGDDIAVAGDVDGDLFAFGSNITIDGDVNGSIYAIGQNIAVNGSVDGSVYSLALSLALGGESLIENNLYYVGVQFASGKGSQIGRDMNGAMLSARLGGGVGRDTKAIIGLLELIRFAMDMQKGFPAFSSVNGTPATLLADRLAAGAPFSFMASGAAGEVSSAIPASDVAAHSPTPVHGRLAKTVRLSPTAQNVGEQTAVANPLADAGIELLRRLVMFLIVGGLLAWLRPDALDEWAGEARRRPLSSLGNGFVFYFVGFVALLFMLFLALAVGLALFRIQLGELAWVFWGISFSGIGLGFWLFLALLVFVSKVIVAYLGGLFLLEKIYPQAADHKIWPLLSGLLVYLILVALPYLGWFISLLVTWLGMGAALIVCRRRASRVEEAVFADQEATAVPAK